MPIETEPSEFLYKDLVPIAMFRVPLTLLANDPVPTPMLLSDRLLYNATSPIATLLFPLFNIYSEESPIATFPVPEVILVREAYPIPTLYLAFELSLSKAVIPNAMFLSPCKLVVVPIAKLLDSSTKVKLEIPELFAYSAIGTLVICLVPIS